MLNACCLAAEQLVLPEALVLEREDLKSKRFPLCQLLPRPVGILVMLHAWWQGRGCRMLPASLPLLTPERDTRKRSLLPSIARLQLIVKGSLI